MKNNYFTAVLLLILINSYSYAQEIEETVIEETEIQVMDVHNSSNQYSNDQIPTSLDELIENNQYKKITGSEKTEKDLIIILKNDGEFSSYDFKTLEHKWDFKFSDSSYNKMRNRFRIEKSILYATSTQKQFVALNVNNGEAYWKTQIGVDSKISKRYEINGQRLPIKGDLIFLASNNKQLYAFNKLDGNLVWNYKLEFPYNNYSPVLNDDYLVIPNAPYVYCFEANTGKAIWQRGFGNTPMYSQLQIDNNKVYTASENNNIYALNIEDLASIDWEFKTEYDYADIDENTIIENKIYYFGAKNDYEKPASVIALHTADGQTIWKTDLTNEGREIRQFHKHDEFIAGFTDAEENNFFVINAATGKQLKVKNPKEKAVSNIVSQDNSLVFITKNYLVSYDLKNKAFSYQDLKLAYEVNDSFGLYFEIVRAQE